MPGKLPPETPEQFEAREALNRTPFNSPDYKKMEKAAYPDLPPTTTETKK